MAQQHDDQTDNQAVIRSNDRLFIITVIGIVIQLILIGVILFK